VWLVRDHRCSVRLVARVRFVPKADIFSRRKSRNPPLPAALVESCPEQELVGFNYQADYVSLAFTANCGDFAPTFVNDNIGTVFGYTPAEYLENPSFWRGRVSAKQHSVVRH